MGTLVNRLKHCKSINMLLIAAILLTAVLPVHYHLHHLHTSDASTHGHTHEHEHAIDLHLLYTDTDQSHHEEHTSTFAATPDVIVKKGSFDLEPYLLPAVLVIFLAVFRSGGTRHGTRNTAPRQHCHYLSPPLRAPPV